MVFSFSKNANQIIARRVLLLILIFSGIVTLMITAIQIYFEYERDIHALDDQFKRIEAISINPLAQSLWFMNEDSIKLQLHGILNLRDIEYLELAGKGNIFITDGKKGSKHTIERIISLTHKNDSGESIIGKLTVVASKTAIYSRLFGRLITILVSQSIIIFLLSIFIFLIVHHLVIKHLSFISSYLKGIDIEKPHSKIALERRARRVKDELDQVVISTNEMIQRQKDSYSKIEQVVKKRTAELTQKNEQLKKEIEERKRAEEALRESEEHLRSFMENAKGFAAYRLRIDPNDYYKAHVVFVSPNLKDIVGVSPREEFSEWFKNIHEDDLPSLINAQNESAQSGAPLEQEFRLKGLEGKWRWLHVISNPVFDSEGKLEYFNGITIDITEQKQAKQALRESEKRLNAILDATTETIVLLDSKGIVHAANRTVCDRLETTKEEFIGKRIYNFFPPDVAKGRKQKWHEVFDTGKPVSFEDSRKNMTFEQKAYPVLDEEGQVQMVVAFANDKTDRKLAEEALRESEEKFRLISEQSLLAIGIIQDGHIIYANEMYSKLTGYSLEDIYGWEPYGYARTVYKDDIPLVMKQSRKKQAGDEDVITNYQFRGFTKSKEIVWWDLHSNTITYHGRPADLFTLIDVTEKVESEKERVALQTKLQHSQKMEAIGTLAGGVAHDLNNILGGLVSYPELLLLQLPLNSALRKSILTIQKSGEKAAAVVQDLLTLARRGVVVTEVVNLNDIIAEYLKSPEHEKLQSYHPGVHIDAHLEKDTLNILGSSTHLSKTVMNLVSNAAEAMPEGGNLVVSTENRYIDRPIRGYDNVKEGDYAVFTISDTGTGISPDDIGKIFEPFYTKKKMGRSGTGLGMAVVWGTVKDHNGYIDAQSAEGKGTTFTLHFPVTRKSIEERSHLAIETYSGNGESILVIDDVEEQRNIASGMLKELGYSVAMVSSGEEAVEYLKTRKVDLLLLDMIMDPGMDGLDTYKEILKVHPGQKAVIASGFSESARVRAVQRLGAGAYVKKPFLLEKIGMVVKEALGKKHFKQEIF